MDESKQKKLEKKKSLLNSLKKRGSKLFKKDEFGKEIEQSPIEPTPPPVSLRNNASTNSVGASENEHLTYEVTLRDCQNGLGFTFRSGPKEQDRHVIDRVRDNCLAAQNGIHVGDELLEVGGKRVLGLPPTVIVDLIRECGSTVHLKLSRPPARLRRVIQPAAKSTDFEVHAARRICAAASMAHEPFVEWLTERLGGFSPRTSAVLNTLAVDGKKAADLDSSALSEFGVDAQTAGKLGTLFRSLRSTMTVTEKSDTHAYREFMLFGCSAGLGFTFRSTCRSPRPRHIVDRLVDGSIAQRANVLPGDELLEINGVVCLGKTPKDVVAAIKAGGDEVRMRVRTPFADKIVALQGVILTHCKSQGTGFTFRTDPRKNRHYVESVAADLPASLVDLPIGSELVMVGVDKVRGKDHGAVLDMIRECGDAVPLKYFPPRQAPEKDPSAQAAAAAAADPTADLDTAGRTGAVPFAKVDDSDADDDDDDYRSTSSSDNEANYTYTPVEEFQGARADDESEWTWFSK